jgi:hypothetical protein
LDPDEPCLFVGMQVDVFLNGDSTTLAPGK